MPNLDQQLYDIVMRHLSRLDDYTYKKSLEVDKLQKIYAQDPLFSVFGLDSPDYIVTSRGGGLVTSVHRKIGDAMQETVQVAMEHQLELSAEQLSYRADIASGDQVESRSIDCFIALGDLRAAHRHRIHTIARRLTQTVAPGSSFSINGLGFEVRHCYQSADSKRVQADEAMARHLYLSNIVPVMLVFCGLSNRSVMDRYRHVWVLTEGMASFDLVSEITAYDFYGFFTRHADVFRVQVAKALSQMT